MQRTLHSPLAWVLYEIFGAHIWIGASHQDIWVFGKPFMTAQTASGRATLLLLPIAAMAFLVALSNVLVQYPLQFWGLDHLLTWAAFSYPITFFVTDLTNRRFGAKGARIVVYVGFALAVALSVWLATPRIALASGSAFLVAQLLDVSVFDKLRQGRWWKAPLVSSVLGIPGRHGIVLQPGLLGSYAGCGL